MSSDFFHWDEELIIEVFSHFKLFSCTMTATEFAIDVDILQLLLVQSANKKDVCEWRIAVPNKSLPDWRPMVARNPFFYRIDLFSKCRNFDLIGSCLFYFQFFCRLTRRRSHHFVARAAIFYD